jgi:hypothetical protein
MRGWIVPDAVLYGFGRGCSVVGGRCREVDVAALVTKGPFLQLVTSSLTYRKM